MFNDLNQVLSFDWKTILIALLLLGFLSQKIIELTKWVIHGLTNFFGWETKWARKERERKDLIEKHECRFQNIDMALSNLERKSEEHDHKIEASINKLTTLMEQHVKIDDDRTIATLRSTLWRIHKECMSQGYITREGLRTFMECGRVYEEAGGDDIYHEKLEPEILNLEVR